MEEKTKEISKTRVIALLDREQIEFLHRLSLESLFSTGHKMSLVEIMSALVDVARKLNISAKDITKVDALSEKIISVCSNYLEKRNFPRIKKHLKVSFRTSESLKEPIPSQTQDLSLGGLRLEISSAENLPQINQLLEISLKDPKEKEKEVKALGKVVWIRQCEDKNRLSYQVGVKLTYIMEEDRFMQYLSKEAT